MEAERIGFGEIAAGSQPLFHCKARQAGHILREFAVKRGEADAEVQRGFFLVAAHLRENAVEIVGFLLAQEILERQVGVMGCGNGRAPD